MMKTIMETKTQMERMKIPKLHMDGVDWLVRKRCMAKINLNKKFLYSYLSFHFDIQGKKSEL